MIHHTGFAISYLMIAFIVISALVVGGLLAIMHMRHKYHPNLIGALIGAFLCFLLLEALPALT
ncbi:hypothetical protein [Paraburkholderia sp.]|uniref:hypothetical protein n=1 Tax=Paraburkholderia sp. TaxID=1926495 RepID=UPI0023A0A2ED|nr:hypothetical protein [Paraburkholderia sp.]MDE1183050.1 hypothetical protein [Paraburkholderia sp.]